MSSAAAQARVTALPKPSFAGVQRVPSWTRGGIAWRKVPAIMLGDLRRWLKPGTYHVLGGLFLLADCENDWITVEHPRTKARIPANKTKLGGILGVSDDVYRPAISELEEMGLLKEEKFGREKWCRLAIERWPIIARGLAEQERAGAEPGPTRRGPKPGTKTSHRPPPSDDPPAPQHLELEPGGAHTVESEDIAVECINTLPIRVSVTLERDDNVIRVSLSTGYQKGEENGNETTGEQTAKDSAEPAFEGQIPRVFPGIPPSPNVARRPPDQAAESSPTSSRPVPGNTVQHGTCTAANSEQKANTQGTPRRSVDRPEDLTDRERKLWNMLRGWAREVRMTSPDLELVVSVDGILGDLATAAELRMKLDQRRSLFENPKRSWGGVKDQAKDLVKAKSADVADPIPAAPTCVAEEPAVSHAAAEEYEALKDKAWAALSDADQKPWIDRGRAVLKAAGAQFPPDEGCVHQGKQLFAKHLVETGELPTLEQYAKGGRAHHA